MEKEKEKELDELIKETEKRIEGFGGCEPGSITYGKGALAIPFQSSVLIYKSVKSLEDSINKNSEASNQLSRQVLRLNKILTWATVIVAIATVAGVIAAFCR
ncbi:MAG TPA: hypothetical protein VM658_15810 [bacterium]|nr:hypothetical protein [bacterium]